MKTIYKEADTSRAGTVLAIADPDFQFLLEANSTYLIRGQMRFRGSTAGGIRHGFSAGGASLLRGSAYVQKWRDVQPDTVKSAEVNGGTWTSGNIVNNITKSIAMHDGSYSIPIRFVAMIDVGITSGTFSVIWAQNIADSGVPAKLLAGAIMTYEKLV